MNTPLALALAILVLIPNPALAADGDLDLTFGIGGRVTTELSGLSFASASALQRDGKIIVAGTASLAGDSYFVLARYNGDGTVDTTFGLHGKVTTNFSSSRDMTTSLALQSDGKIIVAGQAGSGGPKFNFALVRYNPDGSLDTAFGVGGKVITDLSGFAQSPGDIAIQSDGRIIVVGVVYASDQRTSGDFALVRYEQDGSLDTTFGIDGKVITDLSGTLDVAQTVDVQFDGKIVVGGVESSFGQQTSYGALARYNQNGSLDTTFGIGGKVTTQVLDTSDIRDLVIQSDGKIPAAGSSRPNGSSSSLGNFGLVRYNADGSLDTMFGVGGKVTTAFGPWRDSVWALSLQPDGKIVAGGDTDSLEYAASAFCLARYNRDGSLDTSFGIGGKVKTEAPPGRDAYNLRSLEIQSDGKIVAVGTGGIQNWYFSAFELARYNTTGLLLVSDINFDQTRVGAGGSWSATLSGTNLTNQTYFDVRFRSPGSNTDQVALNWQRGLLERHDVSTGVAPGTWIITGVRAHDDAGDHNGEFVSVSATLTVDSF